jgi:hypothetical protein
MHRKRREIASCEIVQRRFTLTAETEANNME